MERDQRQTGPQDLGSVLKALLGRGALGRRHRRLDAARRAWIAAAGEELSAQTRVRSLRDGVLMVEVASPPLCHRLASFDRDALLLKAQEAARDVMITGLRFRLGAFEEEGKIS